MKKIIIMFLLVVSMTLNSYAAVYVYPDSPYDCDSNMFYIDYNIDKFNDIKLDDRYLINRRYGTFSNENIHVYNQKCVFYITLKTYTDSLNHYFGIGMSLYGNTDVINEYYHSLSIKYDNQTFDYPYPVRMGKAGWLHISEVETPDLYQVLFLLLAQGKTFKIRLDEISDVGTYYVFEVLPTNFAEAFTYCYG